MIRVLFVCLGNICRSPMAEGVFQHLVDEAGLSEQILVQSAGTSGYHVGEPAHGGTRDVLKRHGVKYNGRSAQLHRRDFSDYDYILAMDESNLRNIKSAQPENTNPTIKLFLDYAEGIHETSVPDPYYTGGFDNVYQMVEAGAQGLLAAIRQEHNL